MDLLGYKGRLTSFGKSLKDTSDRAVVFMYQHPHILEIVTDQVAVQYDKTKEKVVHIEYYKNNGKINPQEVQKATNRLKAYIQNYSYAQRNNKLLTRGKNARE